jgi:hypothetical protein
MHQHLVAGEQQVNFFEAQPGRLRITVVNEGNEAEVEDAEVYVGLVSDRVDRHGRDFDDDEVELKSSRSAPRIELWTGLTYA